jgi:hypothetical protein
MRRSTLVDVWRLRAGGRCETLPDARRRVSALGRGAMSATSEAEFDYDRYRKLLAEADDESKRLAFINLLIEENAKDKLALHSIRATLVGMGITTKPHTD